MHRAGDIVTHVIGLPCVDVKDRSCIDECPVDAIYYEDDVPEKWVDYYKANVKFFDIINNTSFIRCCYDPLKPPMGYETSQCRFPAGSWSFQRGTRNRAISNPAFCRRPLVSSTHA